MSVLEEKLARYKAPSSNTEQEKQERAERMVRKAVEGWNGFDGIGIRFLPKGSYKNNTNVRADSDVDIAVIHKGFNYYNDSALYEADKIHSSVSIKRLAGASFRAELEKATRSAYGNDCDTSGSTAIEIAENGGRVKADVVPSFEHRKYYYDTMGKVRYFEGTTTRRTNGDWVINYPEQQYANGVAKNNRTGMRYKQMVRILKRVENDLVVAGKIEALPSYFMECLVYRVPDGRFNHGGLSPLTDDITSVITYIWNETKPGGSAKDWHEPNGIKPLFGAGQKWSMEDAHQLALNAWQNLGLS
ncbi:nucleotidyltransferase domain-containing protein [Streptomyces sp. NBC_01236]|uniref:nucleotidyltransferase domain-containing protein n=1 Tax=Streptomyces sp. NBC_01236 TaxID=2903789 RepID=UPI002E125E23|nr:nucleotidyltransferase [Streptomyces sp. NBC_01236]